MTHIRFAVPSGEHPAAHTVTAVLLLTLFAALGQPAAGQAHAAHAISNQHGYGAPKQVLFVAGSQSGLLKSASIIQSAASSGGATQVTVRTTSFEASLLRLIAATLAGAARPTAVQVATFDFNGQPTDAITLARARIQEIDLPGADGSSKDAADITVKFFPAPAEQSMPAPIALGQIAPAKIVIRNDFRLTIDGVDCSRVATVGALAITFPPNLPVRRMGAGGKLTSAGRLPPLVVTISRNFAGPFQQWLATGGTKNGTLTFLATDLTTPRVTVTFTGLRIVTIADDTMQGSEQIARSTVTMSITGMGIGSIKTRSVRMP